jgi:integrase
MARVRKHRDKWQVLYRDPDTGKEVSAGVHKRKIDANRVRLTIERDIATGQWISPDLASTTLNAWATRWATTRTHLKPSTRASEESLLRSRILPTFGEMPLNGIGPHDVDTWISSMIGERLSASRIRQAHSVLGRMLKAAVRSRYISHNAAYGASLPSMSQREMRYLDPTEIDTLGDHIDPRFQVWAYTMAWTGLRFGEAAALRRRNIDVLRSELRIVESVTEVNGKIHFGTTKTNRHRTVHLPAFLRDMLNDHLTTAVAPEADALVFTSTDGGVLRRHNFSRRQWKPATKAAGLGDLRIHDLRHTAAALMISVNESPETVKRQLGHSSIKVTFDVYGHLFPSSMEALAEGLDRLYRASKTG